MIGIIILLVILLGISVYLNVVQNLKLSKLEKYLEFDRYDI